MQAVRAAVVHVMFNVAGVLIWLPFIGLLAELGLFLLMFLAGFEINFGSLEREGRGPILFGLAFYGAVVAIAWLGLGFVERPGSS